MAILDDKTIANKLVKNIEVSQDGSSVQLSFFDGTIETVSGIKKIYNWNDTDITRREVITDNVAKFEKKGILLSGNRQVLLKLDSGDDVDLSAVENVFDTEEWESELFYSAGSVAEHNGSRWMSMSAVKSRKSPPSDLINWVKISNSDLFSRKCELYDTRLSAIITTKESSSTTKTVKTLWDMLFNFETENVKDVYQLKKPMVFSEDGILSYSNGSIDRVIGTDKFIKFKTVLSKTIQVKTFTATVTISNVHQWVIDNDISFILTGLDTQEQNRIVFDTHKVTAHIVDNGDNPDTTDISYIHERREDGDNQYSSASELALIDVENNLANKTFSVSFDINDKIQAPQIEIRFPSITVVTGSDRIQPEFDVSNITVKY